MARPPRTALLLPSAQRCVAGAVRPGPRCVGYLPRTALRESSAQDRCEGLARTGPRCRSCALALSLACCLICALSPCLFLPLCGPRAARGASLPLPSLQMRAALLSASFNLAPCSSCSRSAKSAAFARESLYLPGESSPDAAGVVQVARFLPTFVWESLEMGGESFRHWAGVVRKSPKCGHLDGESSSRPAT